MKNVREKNFKINNFYKSQKSVAFYHNQTIKQKTNQMIKILETIQIQNTIHVKKNNKIDALNKQNNHMKSKQIFDHNILKMNKNESVLININEINATFKILKDDKEQYFVIKKITNIEKQNQRHNKKTSR